jgi:hypothetical protein
MREEIVKIHVEEEECKLWKLSDCCAEFLTEKLTENKRFENPRADFPTRV